MTKPVLNEQTVPRAWDWSLLLCAAALLALGCAEARAPARAVAATDDRISIFVGGDAASGHGHGSGLAADGGALPEGPPSSLTYWADIAPILNAKCVRCHGDGGIAPFRLDLPGEAIRNAALAAKATRAGIMPPYLMAHDGSCGQFEHAETLSGAEKDKIWSWAVGGRSEGTPVVLPPPGTLPLGPAREYRTPQLAPVAQGGAHAQFDEYRCFLFDSGLDGDRFITGYDVTPGTPALVHHVQAYLIDPARLNAAGKPNGAVIAALDGADGDRPGWPCLENAGKDVRIESIPLTWAPGQGPMIYPDGVGVRHPAHLKLVVQMHYNLAESRTKGLSDSTTIRLRHAETVNRRAIFQIGDAFIDTLESPTPRSLPPGHRSVSLSWTRTLAELSLRKTVPYVDLIGIMPHMHERGIRKEVRLGPPGAVKSCLARVDRWDFHWQKFYFYQAPYPRFDPTAEITVRCDYDTSKDEAPVLPGWGTGNEMCTAILMFALPPGT